MDDSLSVTISMVDGGHGGFIEVTKTGDTWRWRVADLTGHLIQRGRGVVPDRVHSPRHALRLLVLNLLSTEYHQIKEFSATTVKWASANRLALNQCLLFDLRLYVRA